MAESNYDRIMAMSIDDFAVFITTIMHERDALIQKKLADMGIDSSLIELSPDVQAAIHKKWLESEVEDNG